MYCDFPSGPVVKPLFFNARGAGSVPGEGTNMPCAAWHDQRLKKMIIFLKLKTPNLSNPFILLSSVS